MPTRAAEGEPGDGPDIGSVEIDVDVPNQFVWFDAGELEELPVDLPDAQPSPEELARITEIAAQFGAGIEAAARGQPRCRRRVRAALPPGRPPPGALDTLDRVGRSLTAY